MKILLTQPLFSSEHLLGIFNPGPNANTFLYGQASLAAVAREAGHGVTFLDPFHSRMSYETYGKFLEKHKFDVVGCTIYTLTFTLAKKLFEYTRKILPNACLVAGGPHVTSLPGVTLKEIPELDFEVFGEGELTFLALLECIKRDKNYSYIDGLSWRRETDKQVIVNASREFISDLDLLPMAAYDLFPMEKYVPTPNLVKRYPTIALQVTRGCPFNCAFCQFNLALGKQYRHRSIDKIMEELFYLKSHYGVRGVVFRDSSLTIDPSFLKELCGAMIKNKLDLKWMCYSRTDIMAKYRKELLPLMKAAGCWQIGYGCESANQRTLDLLNKQTKVSDNITAVQETMKTGIMCSTTWILCLPGESDDDAQRTVRLAKNLASHTAKFFLPLPFPNTDLQKICREDGGLREEASFDEYDLIMPRLPIYINKKIGAKKMIKILRNAYFQYYTNPNVIGKNLITITEWDAVKKYWAYTRMIV